MKKMHNTIKQVAYWYHAPTGNVEWIVDYKTGYRRTYRSYEKETLPKTAKNWLQSDESKLVQIGDTRHGAWHVERWAEA